MNKLKTRDHKDLNTGLPYYYIICADTSTNNRKDVMYRANRLDRAMCLWYEDTKGEICYEPLVVGKVG